MIYSENLTISVALKKLENAKHKCLVLVDNKSFFVGTLTDGDLRRAILKGGKFNEKITKYIFKNSQYLKIKNLTKSNVDKIFNNKKLAILALPILSENNKVLKVVYPNQKSNLISNTRYNNSVVIMAGGKGQRLEPFTSILPKPLAAIDGKTMLEQIMNNFKNYNLKRFIITVNYKKEIIKAYFKENKNYKISFVEENKTMGTAGSLKLILNKVSSDFFLTNCDIMVDANYNDLINFHKKNKYDLTLIASKKNFKVPYGVCHIDKNMMLNNMVEKPNYNFFVNTGLYIIKKKVLKLLPLKNHIDMNEFIKILINNNKKIGVYPIDDTSWIDIGQWKEYKHATENFKNLFQNRNIEL
jgi:dTDP-glucose pyrophosphorylase